MSYHGLVYPLTSSTPNELSNKKIDFFCSENPSSAKHSRSTKKSSTSSVKTFQVDEIDFTDYKKQSGSSKPPRHTAPASKNTTNFIQKNIEISNLLSQNTEKTKDLLNVELISSISFGSEPKLQEPPNIEERFYKKAEKYKKKKEELSRIISNEEVEGCTFQPKTNVKTKGKLSNEEFNRKIEGYINKKKIKQSAAIEKAQAEEREKVENNPEITLRPKLCEKSKELLAVRSCSNIPAYERLYSLSKTKAAEKICNIPNDRKSSGTTQKSPLASQVFFQPVINEKSRLIKRETPVSQSLYNDALRRISKSTPDAKPTSPKYLSENSEKFLKEKFKKDFDSVFHSLSLEDGTLSYCQMIELLNQLHFINFESEDENSLLLQLWNSFNLEESANVGKPVLFYSLLSIIGLYDDLGRSVGIEPEIAKGLQKTFEKLYFNRCTHKKNEDNSLNVSKDMYSECTFQPELTADSENLAEKWRAGYRCKSKIEDMLIEDKIRQQERLIQLRKKVEADEVRECTFAPKTEELPTIYERTETGYSKHMSNSKSEFKGIALHNYSFIHNEKKQAELVALKEMEENKALEECTFVPTIKNSKGGNINDFLERMRERELFKERPAEDSKCFKFGKTQKYKSLSMFGNPEKPKSKRVPKKPSKPVDS